MSAYHNNETSLVWSGYGGQAVSSPLLECQCDAHWGELDWKISDSGRSQKDLAAGELALRSITHTVQRAQNRREPGEIFFTGMENRYVGWTVTCVYVTTAKTNI